jgi:hypothetical protein
MRDAADRARGRGFTLVEMVASLGATAVLLGAMGSLMVLATRAFPSAANASDARLNGGAAMLRIAEDVRSARRLLALTPTEIELELADRTGDGAAETVRFSWSGVAGEPLLRTFNTLPDETIADDVRAFSLTSQWIEKQATVATAATESSAQMLSSYTGSTKSTLNVGTSSWVGLYLRPVLPAGATGWRPTRVLIRARSNLSGGATGSTLVELRSVATNDNPTTTVLASGTMSESALSVLYTWRTVNFSGVSQLAADQPISIVLRPQTLSRTATVAVATFGVLTPYDRLLTSTDSGTNWTVTKDATFEYELWGTVFTPGTSTETTERLCAIEATLTLGDGPQQSSTSVIAAPGRPEGP